MIGHTELSKNKKVLSPLGLIWWSLVEPRERKRIGEDSLKKNNLKTRQCARRKGRK
jgi:hypothetical protein